MINYLKSFDNSVGLEEVSLQGHLENNRLCRVLYEIGSSSITGVFSIDSGWEAKNIYFNKGQLAEVDSNIIDERLTRLLVNKSLITEEMRIQVLKYMTENKEISEGEALVKLGYIDPSTLEDALKIQMSEKIIDLFSWKKGRYAFIPSNVKLPKIQVSLNLKEIICKGIKKHYDLATLKSLLNPIKDQPIAKDEANDNVSKLGFTSEEISLYNSLDGEKTIEGILSSSGLDPLVVYSTIYSLYLFNMIKISEWTDILEEKLENLDLFFKSSFDQ